MLRNIYFLFIGHVITDVIIFELIIIVLDIRFYNVHYPIIKQIYKTLQSLKNITS